MEKLTLKITSIIQNKLFEHLAYLALIPLLLLSFFNHPASDDFYFAFMAKQHTVSKLPLWFYQNWGGRYFSNSLLSISPLYFKAAFLYKIIPIFLILLFYCSASFFVKQFNTINKNWNKEFTGLLFVLYIFQAPEISNSFYWLPGAITYQLAISLGLLFLANLKLYVTNNQFKNYFLTLFFGFCMLGCNEITTITTLFLSIFVLYFYRKKATTSLLILFGFLLFFGALELFAPGNFAREKTALAKHNFIFSLSKSIINSIKLFFEWLPMLLLCSFYFFDKIKTISQKIKNVISPIFLLVLVFSILFINIFIGFWVGNSLLPNRALNTLYFYYMLLILISITYILAYFKNKYISDFEVSNKTKIVLGILILSFVFSNSTISTAYNDLLGGKAILYNKEMNQRFNLIHNCTAKEIEVSSLKNKPTTIYSETVMGLTNDIKNWKNDEISEYYLINITTKPNSLEITE